MKRSLKSTFTFDKLGKFLAGKNFPFNHQSECEHFLLLQLNFIFHAFEAFAYSRFLWQVPHLQSPSPSLNLFFRVSLKLNFQIFPGCGTTENLHHGWCLFLHAFHISSRAQLHKRCGDAPCVPSQFHKVKFISFLRFCCHYSYKLRFLLMRCYPNTVVAFERVLSDQVMREFRVWVSEGKLKGDFPVLVASQ